MRLLGLRPERASSALFVGRTVELARIHDGFARVSMVVLYGTPGIGKTALAFAVARALDATPVIATATEGSLGSLVDDARRALAGETFREHPTDLARCQALAEALDAREATLVLDDLHRLENLEERSLLLHTLGRFAGRGRVIVTSRERLPESEGYDRLELRIGPLSRNDARSLWCALDDLHGETLGFEEAYARLDGDPLSVRRAHAGTPCAGGVRSIVERLDAPTFALAALIALARISLPRVTLAATEHACSLSTLSRHFLIEIDGAEACTMRVAVRDVVLDVFRARAECDVSSVHRRLARLLDTCGLDEITQLRESCHHLRSAGDVEATMRRVETDARRVLSAGGSEELLLATEWIPAARRSAKVHRLRARCHVRLLRIDRALDELTMALSDPSRRHDDPLDRAELRTSLAQVATMAGRPRRALEVLGAGKSDESNLSGGARVRRACIEATAMLQVGRRLEAQRCLDEAARLVPERSATLIACQAVLQWLDASAPPDRRGSGSRPEAARAFRAMTLLPIAIDEAVVRRRFDVDPELALGIAEETLAARRDALSACHALAVRAIRAWEGDRRSEAGECMARFLQSLEGTGYRLAAMWASVFIARLELTFGRRQRGLALLDAIAAEASLQGVSLLEAAVSSARRDDTLARLESTLRLSPVELDASHSVRARALAACRLAAEGQEERSLSMASAIASAVHGAEHGVDAALVLVARAFTARLAGDEVAHTRFIDEARSVAKRAGVDDDLVPQVVSTLRRLHCVTSTRRIIAGRTPRDEDFDVVIDATRHALKTRGGTLSLLTRPTARKLLYALAERPEASLSKAELCGVLWSTRYHPMRHDNPLFANIRRLRTLLEGTGLVVRSSTAGYALTVPESFLFRCERAAERSAS